MLIEITFKEDFSGRKKGVSYKEDSILASRLIRRGVAEIKKEAKKSKSKK